MLRPENVLKIDDHLRIDYISAYIEDIIWDLGNNTN